MKEFLYPFSFEPFNCSMIVKRSIQMWWPNVCTIMIAIRISGSMWNILCADRTVNLESNFQIRKLWLTRFIRAISTTVYKCVSDIWYILNEHNSYNSVVDLHWNNAHFIQVELIQLIHGWQLRREEHEDKLDQHLDI